MANPTAAAGAGIVRAIGFIVAILSALNLPGPGATTGVILGIILIVAASMKMKEHTREGS